MGDSSFRRHGLHTGPFARRAKVPWKECNQMDERLKFIARLLDGEKMAVLCRQFGISRKTGYKILTRYNEIGLEGLTDRSRRPYRHANQLPFQIETQIVRLKQDRPSWGRRRSGKSWPGSIRMCPRRRSARCMRFSIATAWSSAEWGGVIGRRERRFPFPASPMICGAPTTRRVHARRPTLLLSADDHRLRQPLSLRLRGALHHQGSLCLPGVQGGV